MCCLILIWPMLQLDEVAVHCVAYASCDISAQYCLCACFLLQKELSAGLWWIISGQHRFVGGRTRGSRKSLGRQPRPLTRKPSQGPDLACCPGSWALLTLSLHITLATMALTVAFPHRLLRSNSGLLLRSGKRTRSEDLQGEKARLVKEKFSPGIPLTDLPPELLDALLPYLSPAELCALSQACRLLNAIGVRFPMPMRLCSLTQTRCICKRARQHSIVQVILNMYGPDCAGVACLVPELTELLRGGLFGLRNTRPVNIPLLHHA